MRPLASPLLLLALVGNPPTLVPAADRVRRDGPLMNQGKPAEVEFRGTVRLHPDAPARNWLGERLKDLGEDTKAEASYREAIKLDVNLASARSNLARFLQKKGRPPE